MEAVGQENFFLFGMTVEQIQELRSKGYWPYDLYHQDEAIREIVDQLRSGYFSKGDSDLFKPLVDSLMHTDPYFVLQDFRSYVECQEKVSKTFSDSSAWSRMSILNVARMGRFSSDRSIREYCEKIWKVKPIH